MKIYLDDDSANPLLVRFLTKDGHDVVIPAAVGMSGQKDAAHFMVAIREGRTILTHNHDDFDLPHRLVKLIGGTHPGILIVRRDNDPNRDLKPKGIARALGKLIATNIAVPGEIHILNHWR